MGAVPEPFHENFLRVNGYGWPDEKEVPLVRQVDFKLIYEGIFISLPVKFKFCHSSAFINCQS